MERLKKAIHDLHGCNAKWVESVVVIETFQDQTVWEGEVQVFDIHGHPTATRCYAWSHETDEGNQRFVAVLHKGPVDSPQKAVRAAIADEYHS